MAKDKEYMRQYMAKRYKRRKAAAIEQLGGKCVYCGSTEDLQFDHIDRNTKSFTIARELDSVSEKRLQEELAKCQLLCPPCHEEKTLQDLGRQSAKNTHGTLSSFKYCKCSLCKKAKADYMKEWHQKNKSQARS